MSTHQAVISPEKGAPLEITTRQTPSPGPSEILIKVSSIALNPIDVYQRDAGFFITHYPGVFGSDIAGTIVSVGSSVPASAPKAGTRVAAFAHCFFTGGAPDYGAFQTHVLVPAESVTVLPDTMSFNEGALLPMAVMTAWGGWYTIGIPRDTQYKPEDKKGMLVWGGASSIGTAAIQSATKLGFQVYTTASPKNHSYLKELGAKQCFDYKDADVVSKIVTAAKKDGLTLDKAFDAAGQTQECLDILKEFAPGAKLASATPLPDGHPTAEGVEIKFVMAPDGEEARNEHFAFVMGTWLTPRLANGEFVPAPKIQVVGKGLEKINEGLEILKAKVSGVKLVVEI